MAKTYHQVNPEAKIVIFDKAESSLGGVFAKERLYDFKTNNQLGSFEFSDFPMTGEQFGLKPGQHIPSATVYEYLRLYAERYGIASLIRFRCEVETAEFLKDGKWLLTVLRPEPGQSERKLCQMVAKKLVVATGLLSHPFMPELQGSADFKGPLFHTQQLGEHENSFQDKSHKSVVVFGASKSAWDACYLAATHDCQVHWIIRASGNGPTWVAPPYATPFKLPLEVVLSTRALTWFSPSFWGYGWAQYFLHGTWLGRKITATYWALLTRDMIEGSGYDTDQETKKLKGRHPPFWSLSVANVLNYDSSFMALVSEGKIKVHVADLSHLSERAVHLSDGNVLEADSFVCATGWKLGPHLKFLPDGIEQRLGIPYRSVERDELAEKADKVIFEKFPALLDQPMKNPGYIPLTSSANDTVPRPTQPFRLFRFLVPPTPEMLECRNVAFLSGHHTILKPILAQIQALWLTAYLMDKLKLPSNEEISWSTMLWSRSAKWRWPWQAGGLGEKYPQMNVDWLPYADILLKDLGMKTPKARTNRWWWQDLFVAYKQPDFEGLVEEWLSLQDERGNTSSDDDGAQSKKAI